jgi:hypothetical protein
VTDLEKCCLIVEALSSSPGAGSVHVEHSDGAYRGAALQDLTDGYCHYFAQASGDSVEEVLDELLQKLTAALKDKVGELAALGWAT